MTPISPLKVPFELTDARRSGFRAILSLLPLPPNPVTVDVGAGGFCGTTTTDPILDILGGRVICIEADKARSDALDEKYGNRIANVCGFFGRVGARTPYDLIVIDLDASRINMIFESLIDYAVCDGLKRAAT